MCFVICIVFIYIFTETIKHYNYEKNYRTNNKASNSKRQ